MSTGRRILGALSAILLFAIAPAEAASVVATSPAVVAGGPLICLGANIGTRDMEVEFEVMHMSGNLVGAMTWVIPPGRVLAVSHPVTGAGYCRFTVIAAKIICRESTGC